MRVVVINVKMSRVNPQKARIHGLLEGDICGMPETVSPVFRGAAGLVRKGSDSGCAHIGTQPFGSKYEQGIGAETELRVQSPIEQVQTR